MNYIQENKQQGLTKNKFKKIKEIDVTFATNEFKESTLCKLPFKFHMGPHDVNNFQIPSDNTKFINHAAKFFLMD
jgi:hypothetical protein